MLEQRFEAQIIKPERVGGLTTISIPFNAAQVFNSKGRVKVQGTINGHQYRSALISRGNGNYILVIDKKMQKEMGVGPGDVVNVVMDSDIIAMKKPSELIEISPTNMDVITAIKNRRSIRKFTDEKINDVILNTVLDAGFCAPSATNKKPWHFIIIRDKNTLQAISEKNIYWGMLPQAGCCIIVCGDKVVQGKMGFLVEDCSAAIQNMLLAIHGLGLGGVWCGLYSGNSGTGGISDILKLPPKIVPIGMVAVGYPAEVKGSDNRFDESKIHYEKW